MVFAVLPLKVVPEASPVPPLLNVAAAVVALAVVAVVALPDKLAVIVPALKLPDASRATIAEAVFALVAVVAAFGIEVEAVIAPVPLPYTYPVRVVAPVPPLATGNVPLTWVVNPTLPQEGAVPTPPDIRAFPVATSASVDSADEDEA